MTKPVLPDAEQLLAALTAQTGLVGIVTGGAWLAERLHRELKLEVPHGSLDVSFYRDDFQHKGLKHQVTPSAIPFEVEGRDLILVDDVLYTGRTIRAAMNELFDYGRPASIRLAALVDRGAIRGDDAGAAGAVQHRAQTRRAGTAEPRAATTMNRDRAR